MDETRSEEITDVREHGSALSREAPPVDRVATKSWRIENEGPFAQRAQTATAATLLETLQAGQLPSGAEFVEFFRQTKRVWLIAGALVIGLIAAVNVMARVAEWARNNRVKRQEEAVASVTPEHLIARCGKATEDITKEVFPVVLRTMTYQRGGEKLVLAFSRTDEEKSNWVFLTMEDQKKSYDTTEAKIAALPCIDSKK